LNPTEENTTQRVDSICKDKKMSGGPGFYAGTEREKKS